MKKILVVLFCMIMVCPTWAESVTKYYLNGNINQSEITLEMAPGSTCTQLVLAKDNARVSYSLFKSVPIVAEGDNPTIESSIFETDEEQTVITIDDNGGDSSSPTIDSGIEAYGTMYSDSTIADATTSMDIEFTDKDGNSYTQDDLVFKPQIKKIIEEKLKMHSIFTPYNIVIIAFIAIISVVVYNRVIAPRMTFKWVIMKFVKLIYKPFQKAKEEVKEEWDEASK